MRSRLGRAVVVLAMLAPVSAASAAPDLERLRERRIVRAEPPWWRRAMAAPERGVDLLAWPVKRTLIWAEDVNLPERVRDVFYFNDERTAGWFPNFDTGGEIGTAAGVRLFHEDLFGHGEEIRLSTLLAVEHLSSGASLEEGQARFVFLAPAAGGSPVDLVTHVFARADEDEDFFLRTTPEGGFRTGHDVGERDQTSYEIEEVRAHLELDFHPTDRTTAGIFFRPLFGDVEEGEGAEPPIPEAIDGFGGPAVLLGGGAVFRWDARDTAIQTRSGWYARVEGGVWNGVEGETTDGREYRYARYRAEIRRYQPTFHPKRSILVRAVLERVEPLDDRAIPFWDLPVLDEDHDLRAFERNRFRDRGALLVNVEYLYPIRELWEAFLFLDEGQVFRRYSDLDAGRFEWSAGAGLRVYSRTGLLLRAHYAVGEEENQFRFGFEQEF